MRELLPLLPKPSHYAGNEPGSVHKDPETVAVRLALAFPDLYEVGMSYLGGAILYNAVNAHDEFWAERVYAPSPEAGDILREKGAALCSLESDTPLSDFDVLGFSLTHELCYTNILYMLDLGGIPLRAADREESDPLIIAGGGCCFNAEPVAPFFDAMILGDGEEVLVEVLRMVHAAKREGLGRAELLDRLRGEPGVYVPSYFEEPDSEPDIRGDRLPLVPRDAAYDHVEKRLVANLDTAPYPTFPAQAFGAVHDRLTLEIARGCTRGCRFCQAGMIYRPVRERSLDELDRITKEGLARTGQGDLSFLALSAGDFSALAGLMDQSIRQCKAEQVAISLPSLRVGSVSGEIARQIAGIRRTGATLAPEAGSQRLRDVINKGVDEEGLMEHIRTLAANGWQSVKLYFMIGLPTETDEDLLAIADLCHKAKFAPEGKMKMQVSAAISPFVPKPHTPFQWESQIGLDEINRRINFLRDVFKRLKGIRLKWHVPEMSYLEGLFSRGGRSLAPVIERAYARNALFVSWNDHFRLEPWLEALDEAGLELDDFLTERDPDAPLPWDHLDCGVSRRFLKVERKRALEEAITEDCRFGTCRVCGVCTGDNRESRLAGQAARGPIETVLNQAVRDQELRAGGRAAERAEAHEPAEPLPEPEQRGTGKPQPPKLDEALARKAEHVRIWYAKTGPAAYLSQLELQDVFERALRRAGLPMAFSGGFHPLPLFSFARALPVGVESRAEYFDIFLRRAIGCGPVAEALSAQFPPGLDVLRVEPLSLSKKQPQAVAETYELRFAAEYAEPGLAAWRAFRETTSFPWTRQTRKGERTTDIRPLCRSIDILEQGPAVEPDAESESPCILLEFDWSERYVSPLNLARTVMPDVPLDGFRLLKTAQLFD